MKRRKFISLGVIAASTIILNSCFSNNSPGQAIEQFMHSLEKGEIDEAMKFYPDSYSQTLGEEYGQTLGKEKLRAITVEAARKLEDRQGMKSFKINREDIRGDLATVNFTVIYGDGSEETEDINLLRQDGKWRIDLSESK